MQAGIHVGRRKGERSEVGDLRFFELAVFLKHVSILLPGGSFPGLQGEVSRISVTRTCPVTCGFRPTSFGQQAGGGYLVAGYEDALELKSIEVDLAEGSLSGIQYLYSQDGEEWLPLPDLAGNPISLNYLWLVFPDDGTTAVPQVLEILPNP